MTTETLPTMTETKPNRYDLATQGGNVGAISIEQERAIAEAQGQLILAKRFPRDLTAAHLELMESCRIPSLAKVAFYSVPRAGGKVTGPSIRLAEEIARVYGNFEYGHRELSRSADKSEVEVFAWDKEKNNRSVRQITVMHTRDTQGGQIPLRDQKDVDDKIANVASKQVRGRILALLPKWMVQSAIEECQRTIAGNNEEPLAQRIRKMVDSFGKYGVKPDQIAAYLGHTVENATQDDFVDLIGVYNALRDGAKVSDYFTISAAPLTDAAPAAAAGDAPKAKPGRKPKAAAPAAAEVPPVDAAAATMAAAVAEGLVPGLVKPAQRDENDRSESIVNAPPSAQAGDADDANPFDFSAGE